MMQGPARIKMRGWLPAWAFVLAGVALLMPVLVASSSQAGDITLPVPRITLYPGNTITDAMLVERSFRSKDYEGPAFASVREQLVGKVARQTLVPNQPVSINSVREEHVVKQGQPAVVVFQSGGLIISATAMPLQAGAVGDAISLRNTESGTTIRGVVHADGTVRVGTP
jgi:flagella basal body P-ring formation protein FlgA